MLATRTGFEIEPRPAKYRDGAGRARSTAHAFTERVSLQGECPAGPLTHLAFTVRSSSRQRNN